MSKRTDYSKKSELERCALVERIFIEYPRLTGLLAKIEHCHEYSKIAAEPECMFIGGYSGTGKTTLQKFYARKFPRVVGEEGTVVPVLCGRVPGRPSEKTFVTELLRSMGDPEPERGSADSQTDRFRGFLKECGTYLIFIDEFQHFVDKDSEKVLKNISDWLKNLIDHTRKPIIMCGMPYADMVLDAPGNEQLQRRFSVRASLDPFGWKGNGEDIEFRAFLKAVDDELPFNPNRSFRLSEKTVAFRFYCATNGRVGKVMKVIRRAAELAITRSMKELDLNVLAEAYDERLRHDHPDRINPFATRPETLEIKAFEEYVPNIGVTRRRSKSGGNGVRASAILKKK